MRAERGNYASRQFPRVAQRAPSGGKSRLRGEVPSTSRTAGESDHANFHRLPSSTDIGESTDVLYEYVMEARSFSDGGSRMAGKVAVQHLETLGVGRR